METKIVLSFFDSDGNDEMVQAVSGGHDQVVELPPCVGITSLPPVLRSAACSSDAACSSETTLHLMPNSTSESMHPAVSHHDSKQSIPSSSTVQYLSQTHQDMAGKQHLPVAEHLGAQTPSNSAMETSHATLTGNCPSNSSLNASVSEYIPQSSYNHSNSYNTSGGVPMYNHHPNYIGVPVYMPPSNYSYSEEFTDQGFSEPNTSVPPPHSGYEHGVPYTMAFSNGQYFDQSQMHIASAVPHQMYPGHHVFANYSMAYPECYSVDGGGVVRGEEVLGDQPLGGTGRRSSLNASSASAAVGPSTTAPAAASPSASATEYGITTTTAVTAPPQANHHMNTVTMYPHHPSMHQPHSKPSLLHPPPMLPQQYHTAMVKHRAGMNSALMQPSQSMVLVENSNVSLIVCPSNQGQSLPPFNTGAAGQPQRGAHYNSSMQYHNPVMPHGAPHHLAYQNAGLAEHHHRNMNRYKGEQDSRTYRGGRGNRGGGGNGRRIKRNDGDKHSFSERNVYSNNDKSYHSSGDRNLLSNDRVPYGAEGPQSFSGDHCDIRNAKEIHTASNFACVPDMPYQMYSNVEKFKGQPIIMSDMLNHDHQNNGVHYSQAPPYYCPSEGMVPITLMMPQQHIVTTQASHYNHSKHEETYSEATCDNYNNRGTNTNMQFVNKDTVAEKNVNCMNTTNYILNGNLPNESAIVTQQYEKRPLEEPTVEKTCVSLESLSVSSHTEHVSSSGEIHTFESNNAQVQEFSYPSSRTDSPVTDSPVQGFVAPLHCHTSDSGSHTTGAACPPDGCQEMNYQHSNVIPSVSDVSDRIDHQQQHQDQQQQQQREQYLQFEHHDQQQTCLQLEHQEQFHRPQHDQQQLEQQPLQLPIKMQKVCNGFAQIDKVSPILEITTEQELNLSFSMEFGDICPHDVYTEVNKLKASKLEKSETEVLKNDKKVEMTPNKARKPPLFDTKIVDSIVHASTNTNVSKSLQFQFYSNDISSHSSTEAPIQNLSSYSDTLPSNTATSSINAQCVVSSTTTSRHEVGFPTKNADIMVSRARCPEVLSPVSVKSPSLPMQAIAAASSPAVPTATHERASSSSQTSSASTVQINSFTNGVSSRESSLAPSLMHAVTNDKPPLPGLSSAKKLQQQSAATPGAVSAWGKPKDWQNEFKNKKVAIVSPMLELHSTSTSENVSCNVDGSFSIPVSHNDAVSSAVSGKLAGDVLDSARYDIERTKIGGFLLDYKPDYCSVTLQPRGLTNKNYWCYSNTVLQAIVCVPQFVNLYRKMYQLLGDIITPETLPVTHSIISFLNEFSQMNPSTINLNTRARGKKGGSNIVILPEINLGDPFEPSSIHKMLLEKTSGQFMEGYQQDAEEMLSFLLNASHDEFNECLKLASSKEAVKAGKPIVTAPVLPNGQADDSSGPWVTMGPKNKSCITRTTEFSHSPISKIFWGESRSVIRKGNSPVTANLEPFITLPLDIQDDSITSVKEALEQFVSKADVAGYTCTDTQEELTVSNQRLLEQLPEVLILQLKRFVYSVDGGLQKVVKDIALSIDLEINKELTSVYGRKKHNPEKSKYKLISIVYHDGKDANKGHYVCDVYHAGYNCWLHYDDACVKPITAAELHRCNAPRVPYLLFYRREDTFTDGNFPTAALPSNATKRKNKDKRNASKDKDSMERHSSVESKTMINGSVALSQTIIDDCEKKAVVVNGSDSNVDENVERKSSLDRKTSLERKSNKEIKSSQINSQTQNNKSLNKRQDKKSRANKKVAAKNN